MTYGVVADPTFRDVIWGCLNNIYVFEIRFRIHVFDIFIK